MSRYGALNYQDFPIIDPAYSSIENASFVTALSNLLQNFGKYIDPLSLAKEFQSKNINALNLSVISTYDPEIVTAKIGVPETWPSEPNTIVKFQCVSPANGSIIAHFCLINNPEDNTFIDSFDGEVKGETVYGRPLTWLAYKKVESTAPTPIKEVPQKKPRFKFSLGKSNPNPDRLYTMLEGDNIWDLARRFKTPVEELLEHNDISIEEAGNLPVGTVLHLTKRLPQSIKPKEIEYEVFDQPKQMHVSREGGAKKWSFGNVSDWKDMHSTGFYAYGTNLEIVAVARVPIGDEIYAYYLDSRSLGEYIQTKRVAYTVGFNWRDLEEGVYVKPEEPVVKPTQDSEEDTYIAEAQKPEDEAAPNKYKATFQGFDEPKAYVAKKNILVHELDGRRPDRILQNNRRVIISGIFTKHDIVYGRPRSSKENGYWFAIPMDDLISEDELYNTNIPLVERAAMPAGRRNLSLEERGVVALSKILSTGTKISTWLKNKNKE